MGSEVEEHITKKYDIKKRLGKGVRKLFYRTTVVIFINCVDISSVFFSATRLFSVNQSLDCYLCRVVLWINEPHDPVAYNGRQVTDNSRESFHFVFFTAEVWTRL